MPALILPPAGGKLGLALWAGGSGGRQTKKQPRPMLRVGAARLGTARASSTWCRATVSIGRPVLAWIPARASPWPCAAPGRPTTVSESRNEVSETRVGYPFNPLRSAAATPPSGRCRPRPRAASSSEALYQSAPARASSCGTYRAWYLWPLCDRPGGVPDEPIASALEEQEKSGSAAGEACGPVIAAGHCPGSSKHHGASCFCLRQSTRLCGRSNPLAHWNGSCTPASTRMTPTELKRQCARIVGNRLPLRRT